MTRIDRHPHGRNDPLERTRNFRFLQQSKIERRGIGVQVAQLQGAVQNLAIAGDIAVSANTTLPQYEAQPDTQSSIVGRTALIRNNDAWDVPLFAVTDPLGRATWVPVQLDSTGEIDAAVESFAPLAYSPVDVAFGNGSFLYVVDQAGHKVEKRHWLTGTLTATFGKTVAGAWSQLSTFGSIGSGVNPIQFNNPGQVAVDSSGFVYVADTGNNRLLKTTAAGVFQASVTGLTGITGVAVDGSGGIYVAWPGNVRKYNASFVLQWTAAGVSPSAHLATNGTTLWATFPVAAPGTAVIAYVCATGAAGTSFGTAGTGNGQFNTPTGICYNPSDSLVYVVDAGNTRVQAFNTSGTYQKQWALPSAGATACAPDASGDVFVAFKPTGVVRHYTNVGVLIDSLNQSNAAGLGVTAAGDVVYASDATNGSIGTWDEGSSYTSGSANGEFNAPGWVASPPGAGSFYVSDAGNSRIQRFSNTADTYTSQLAFSNPGPIAIDPTGTDVYCIETATRQIWRMSAALAGAAAIVGGIGTGDGQFLTPVAIEFSALGNLLVYDAERDDIQEFSPAGAFVAKYAGHGSAQGQLDSPGGGTVDRAGRLWISDRENNRISVLNTNGTSLATILPVELLDFTDLRGWTAAPSTNLLYAADAKNNRVLRTLYGSGPHVISAVTNPASGDVLRHRNGVWVNETADWVQVLPATSFTAVAQLLVDGFFTTTYDRYFIEFYIESMGGVGALCLQFRIAGVTQAGALYSGGYSFGSNAGGGSAALVNGATQWILAHAAGSGLTVGVAGTLHLFKPASTRPAGVSLPIFNTISEYRQAVDVGGGTMAGGWLNTPAVDGFRIFTGDGSNMVNGFIAISALRKS